MSEAVAKIDLRRGTVVSKSMLTPSDEKLTDDLRTQEYNCIVLPTQLQDGNVIDVRLTLPSGHDFIVISKKRVTIPSIMGKTSEDTISMQLTEDETLMMSGAIVEAYMMKGAKLYAAIYVEAGTQKKASLTYQVDETIGRLINDDPNILKEARDALNARYNATSRSFIQQNKDAYADPANYESSLQEQINRQRELRKKYLDSLSVGAPVY